MVETYRSGSGNTVVLRPQRRASSAASALGEGLAALGQAGERVAQNQQAVRDAREDADFRLEQQRLERARSAALATGLGGIAALQTRTAQEIADLRRDSEPGATGHENAVRQLLEGRAAEFLGTLPDDPEVQQRFRPMVEQWTGRAVTEEAGWELGRRVEHQGNNLEAWVTTVANEQRRTADPRALDAALTQGRDVIAAMDVDGTAKAALEQTLRQALVTGQFDGLLAQGRTEAVRAAIATGQFDWLDERQRQGFLSQADTLDRAAAREAELQQSEARKAALDALKSLQVDIANGTDVPASAIQGALAAAEAAGVPEHDRKAFAYLGEEAVTRGQFRQRPTETLEREAEALLAQANAGTLDAAGQRRLDTLETMLGERDTQVGASLKQIAAQGPAGQVQAATQLAGMTPERRWAAAREAGDTRLAVYANLTPNGRAFAAEGRSLRTARPEDFLPEPPRGESGKAAQLREADRLFRAELGGALVDQLGGAYGDHLEAVLDVMAGTTRKWDDRQFRQAVQAVFGATRRPSGEWQGGIATVRGRKVELPGDVTAAEFDRAYSRQSFDGAIYADGRAASPADIRTHYAPRYVGEEGGATVYELIGPDGRPLKHRSGGRTLLRVRKGD